jgi:ABC-type cobalamin/Fe3+-siderophores transport system ATPase subunit
VGKTTLLRAVMGFIPIDGGHISIDGELLTPQSAPYFRRQMAYVPQQLSLPEGYTEVQTDYLWLLNRAIESGKQLLIIDEPQSHLSTEEYWEVDCLLMDAARKGMTILAVNDRITQNQIQL